MVKMFQLAEGHGCLRDFGSWHIQVEDGPCRRRGFKVYGWIGGFILHSLV